MIDMILQGQLVRLRNNSTLSKYKNQNIFILRYIHISKINELGFLLRSQNVPNRLKQKLLTLKSKGCFKSTFKSMKEPTKKRDTNTCGYIFFLRQCDSDKCTYFKAPTSHARLFCS